MLKDNAYGHGLLQMAKLAHEAGVRHAVVRRLGEAWAIEHLFETILVLSEIPNEAPVPNIRVAINGMRDIEKLPAGAAVELKVDTGMHRNGIEPEMFAEAVEKIASRGLELVGVMTHYRSADEMGSDFFWQKKRFERIREEALRLGVEGVRWHSCNSAALFRTGDFDEDIARVGIAAYGCLHMPPSFDVPELRPVASLWADRIATRDLEAGERVGYGGEGSFGHKTAVSSYDIGYGDGWPRRPYTLPCGKRIVGRVSMDSIIVEGSDESICIFDDAAVAAKQLGTISYEVTTRLSPYIERIVV